MRKIKSFNDFNKINEEESWKEKVLAASLAASSLAPSGLQAAPKDDLSNFDKKEISYEAPQKGLDKTIHWPWQPKTKTLHKKVTSDEEVAKYERRGWTLDSTQIDTVWREVTKVKPDTMITVDEIKLDDNQYFASGSFTLNQNMKDSIDGVINDIIESGGLLSGVMIESSTDKQGLSMRLQKELSDLGFSPDNTGLSKIRCNQVSDYLISLGVNDSLIQSKQLVETGKGQVDPSARYVIIKIAYLDKDVVTTPEIIEKVPEIKQLHYLSKEVEITKTKKQRHHHHKVRRHKTHVKKHRNINSCFEFQ